MPSRPTVVLLSLLLAIPPAIFWLWLMIHPIKEAIECPKECRCDVVGFNVNCSDSGLSKIPSNIPTHLRILKLDGNDITVFDNDSFVSKGLIELEVLQADYCKIRTIELGAFSGLTLMIYLSLKSNNISEIISGTFENFSRLEYLFLSYNKIEFLGSDTLYGLVKLKYMYLQGNKLKYLHPDTFVALPNLQHLDLANNPRLQIPTDSQFINSHSLKHLYMSDCYIYSLSVETFANISELILLDLRHNCLKIVGINMLKSLPRLSDLYLFGNPLQCYCQLQEVWRWCQDHNIQTAFEEIVPVCDTPSEVKGERWGVLDKGQCLYDNIHENINFSCTTIEDVDKERQTDTYTENEQRKNVSSVVKQYGFAVSVIILIFGITGNVIVIIIITYNKDMQTVPNMYILNLAISDIIYLTLLFLADLRGRIHITWLSGEIGCAFFAFCYQMSVSLTAYSVAVLSIQRYRVIVNPLHVHVSSQSTWRDTRAIICGVWIVAAVFTIPTARSHYFCSSSLLLRRTNYYQHYVSFHLLVCCVFPLCVMAFSYIKTARHLMESSSSFSEETKIARLSTRKNSAKLVLGLTVVFLISYVPYHIWITYVFFSINFHSALAKFFGESDSVDDLIDTMSFLKIFLSFNSCLNPVALFCTSLAFRRRFKRFLTCCFKTKSPPTVFELTRRT